VPSSSPEYLNAQDGLLAIHSGSWQSLPLPDLQGMARPIGKIVSQGPVWEIWEGRWLNSAERRVAMKILRAKTPSHEAIHRVDRQIRLLRKISDHPNIIGYWGYSFTEEQQLTLVFPWMDNGDITNYLENSPNANRHQLAFGIASGLAHMHIATPDRKPIVHGSLYPANVLIDNDGRALLSDFSVARHLEDGNSAKLSVNQGSDVLRYQAPEYAGEALLSTASDVFALAMTMLEVIGGHIPFSNKKLDTQATFAIARGERPSRDREGRNVIDGVWLLFEKCWAQDCTQRPSAMEVVQRLLVLYPELKLDSRKSPDWS